MFKKLIIEISKSIWLLLIVFAVFSIFFFTCDKTEEKLAGPMLVSPANHTTLTTVTPRLQWLAVENAVNYEVFVDDLDDFTDPEFSSLDMEGTECKVDTLQEGLHYWKVRAKNGNWSHVWYFTIDTTGPDAPSLFSPERDETIAYNNTLTFDWSEVSDATSYILVVDNESSFYTPEIDKNDITISEYTPDFPLSDGTYFWRVRAKDSPGNLGQWSSVRSFKIYFHETGTVTDIDGNVYLTVKIGDQWWMAENLKVTHYRNGDAITKMTNAYQWCFVSTGAYCNYENDDANAVIYGSLYNKHAARDNRNIAPEGWHVPTDEEWKKLEMYLGMSRSEADKDGWRGTDEGDKLKKTGMIDGFGDRDATNESGFSALASGSMSCVSRSEFSSLGFQAFFYSSDIYVRHLSFFHSEVHRFGNQGYLEGYSIRLIKD